MGRVIPFLMAAIFVANGLLVSEAWAGKKAVKGEHIQEGLTTRKAGGDPQFTGKATAGNPKASPGSRTREPGKLEVPNIK
jgi:hypothetical protein